MGVTYCRAAILRRPGGVRNRLGESVEEARQEQAGCSAVELGGRADVMSDGGDGPVATGQDPPGALWDPAVVQRRRAMLRQPHVAALTDYADALGAAGHGFVPYFDPLDGGMAARLLILLEKPGPRTFPPRGSGFVSMDNADPTARTIHAVRQVAGMKRRGLAVWNIIPWWNGTTALTGPEKRRGAAELPRLLALLPGLRGVLCAGNQAWEHATPVLRGTGLALFRSVHPGAQARIGPASRDAWLRLPEIWREAWASCGA